MICSVVYRHPSSNLETFFNNFYSLIGEINQERKLWLTSGDLNINLLNYNKHPLTENFVNTLGPFLFEPHLRRPTRSTSYSSTLIKNIFFNSINYQTVSGNLFHDLTDNLPYFLIIERVSFQYIRPEKSYKRDYSNYNEEADEFSFIDWSNLLHGLSDTTEMFDKFYTKVSNIINRHLPLKPLTRKESKFQTKPLITPGFKASIINKNKLYRQSLKTRTCYSHTKFKCYGNKLNHLLKLSKNNYYIKSIS